LEYLEKLLLRVAFEKVPGPWIDDEKTTTLEDCCIALPMRDVAVSVFEICANLEGFLESPNSMIRSYGRKILKNAERIKSLKETIAELEEEGDDEKSELLEQLKQQLLARNVEKLENKYWLYKILGSITDSIGKLKENLEEKVVRVYGVLPGVTYGVQIPSGESDLIGEAPYPPA